MTTEDDWIIEEKRKEITKLKAEIIDGHELLEKIRVELVEAYRKKVKQVRFLINCSQARARRTRKMGSYRISAKEIAEAIDEALDKLEGDFTDKELQKALNRAKLYPFVCDKAKSVPKYVKAKELLSEQKGGK